MTETTAKHPGGRPSIYSAELAERICDRLANGEPLAKICADDDMPSFGTVYRWERENEEFRQHSMQAREIGTHYLADDCIRISDDKEIDPADKRIMVDTRLRLIGKWNAKKYGDRQQHEHTGRDGGPIQFASLTDEELAARIATLEGKPGAEG